MCICVYMYVCKCECKHIAVCVWWPLVSVGLGYPYVHLLPFWGQEGDWSSGMIPALGAGGHEFDSRITPFCLHSLTSGISMWTG